MRPRTIALNMIIGPNDHLNLLRCLSTIKADKFFDEIVLCFTGTENEDFQEMDRSLLPANTRILFSEWISDEFPFGNFSIPRNKCIDHSESEYIWCMDCDDIIEYSDVLLKLKEDIFKSRADFYMMEYLIDKKKDGTFGRKFLKERIFKNNKDIRWKYAVHEQLDLVSSSSMVTIKGIKNEHHSEKNPEESICRNLKIIEHELKTKSEYHYRLFYFREYLSLFTNTKNKEHLNKALNGLKDIINRHEGTDENLAVFCYEVAMHLLYKQDKDTDNRMVISYEDIVEAELYARLSLAFNDKYAEPHVFLGDIYLYREDLPKAMLHFKTAMGKKLDGIGFQSAMYYEEYPARRLTQISLINKQPDLAVWYSSLVLKHNKNDTETRKLRVSVLEALLKKELSNV